MVLVCCESEGVVRPPHKTYGKDFVAYGGMESWSEEGIYWSNIETSHCQGQTWLPFMPNDERWENEDESWNLGQFWSLSWISVGTCSTVDKLKLSLL